MDFSSYDFQTADNAYRQEYNFDSSHELGDMHHSAIDTTTDFFSFVDVSASFPCADNVDGSALQEDKLSSMPQVDGGYSGPQQTPDLRDTFTNSSVLSGHNPEYIMSPLQISAHDSVSMPSRHDSTGKDYRGDGQTFTPLVSPTEDATFDRLNHTSHAEAVHFDNTFSPLTSPALHAVSQSLMLNDRQALDSDDRSHSAEEILKQRLDFLNRQQQQLLEGVNRQLQGHALQTAHQNRNWTPNSSALVSSPHLHASASSNTAFQLPSSSSFSSASVTMPIHTESMHTPTTTAPPSSSHTTASPQFLRPQQKDNAFLAPATPSLLMKLGNGSGTASHRATSLSAVDDLSFLPDAMLQDKWHPPTVSAAPSKRRRLTSRPNASFTSPGLPPTAHMSPLSQASSISDPTIAALVSPMALRPQINPAISAASPRSLKPLISPSLKPNGQRLSAIEEKAAAAALASKSNYQNMREGKAKILGIEISSSFQSGVENRRSAHKAAEQKRRDTLKQSFDSLRKEIADALVDKEAAGSGKSEAVVADMKAQKEKEVKQMSKVLLIQHSYEYILQLKDTNRKKDNHIEELEKKLQEMKSRLGIE